jgi:HAE1 family hydrophobic/amphiphilic exporter-1
LKPTQCALWLRPSVPPEQRNLFYRGFNAIYNRVENAYAWLIGVLVRRSGFVVLVGLIVSGLGIWGIARLPTAFIPNEDQGYAMIAVQLPDGAALGELAERGNQDCPCDTGRETSDHDCRNFCPRQ